MFDLERSASACGDGDGCLAGGRAAFDPLGLVEPTEFEDACERADRRAPDAESGMAGRGNGSCCSVTPCA